MGYLNPKLNAPGQSARPPSCLTQCDGVHCPVHRAAFRAAHPDRLSEIIATIEISLLEMSPGEGLRHEEREDEADLGVDLDGRGVLPDLAPGDGLVRPRAGVRAVELTGSVHENTEVGAVAHEVGVTDVVLDEAAAEDDHAGVDAPHGQLVDQPQVAQDVHHQPGLPGAKIWKCFRHY